MSSGHNAAWESDSPCHRLSSPWWRVLNAVSKIAMVKLIWSLNKTKTHDRRKGDLQGREEGIDSKKVTGRL